MKNGHSKIDDCVRRSIATISDEARECVLLRTLGGLGYAQIARRIGISEADAEAYVHQTRRMMRARLAQSLSSNGTARVARTSLENRITQEDLP